jgi:hypothetical protein
LNRQVVKSWLANSGVYEKALRSFFTLDSNQGIATKEDIQKAFDVTFPPSYIQQQTNVILDATYDWIDGKQPAIVFSIPIKEKRDAFTANLTSQIEPRIAALPQCTTRTSPATDVPTCLPQGVKASDYTSQLLRLSDSDDFLAKPITPQLLAQSGQPLPNISALPTYANYIRTLTAALPVGILLCAAAYVLLSDSKLRGLAMVSRRTFFHGLFVAVAGGLLWWFGASLDLGVTSQGADAQQIAVVKNILNPLMRHVLPDLGRAIILYSGIVTLVGGIGWLTAFIFRRRLTRVAQFSPKPIAPAAPPQTPPAPQPEPTQLPKPQEPPKPPRIML